MDLFFFPLIMLTVGVIGEYNPSLINHFLASVPLQYVNCDCVRVYITVDVTVNIRISWLTLDSLNCIMSSDFHREMVQYWMQGVKDEANGLPLAQIFQRQLGCMDNRIDTLIMLRDVRQIYHRKSWLANLFSKPENRLAKECLFLRSIMSNPEMPLHVVIPNTDCIFRKDKRILMTEVEQSCEMTKLWLLRRRCSWDDYSLSNNLEFCASVSCSHDFRRGSLKKINRLFNEIRNKQQQQHE